MSCSDGGKKIQECDSPATWMTSKNPRFIHAKLFRSWRSKKKKKSLAFSKFLSDVEHWSLESAKNGIFYSVQRHFPTSKDAHVFFSSLFTLLSLCDTRVQEASKNLQGKNQPTTQGDCGKSVLTIPKPLDLFPHGCYKTQVHTTKNKTKTSSSQAWLHKTLNK